MSCHIECWNKKWRLQELENRSWINTPFVKIFTCLSEVRKAYITYSINPDFRDIRFRIKEFV